LLAVGRARAAAGHLDERVSFVEGNAEMLAFPDRHFDGYTIAFGIRNVPRIDLALKEAFRVLKHGGRFLCLEFSTVDVPGLDRIYDLFSFKVIPPLGQVRSGTVGRIAAARPGLSQARTVSRHPARCGRRRDGARSGKPAGPAAAVLPSRS